MVLGTGYMYTYIYHGTGWRVDGEVFEEVKKITSKRREGTWILLQI